MRYALLVRQVELIEEWDGLWWGLLREREGSAIGYPATHSLLNIRWFSSRLSAEAASPLFKATWPDLEVRVIDEEEVDRLFIQESIGQQKLPKWSE